MGVHGSSSGPPDSQVSGVVRESIGGVLEGEEFQFARVADWTSSIIRRCINALSALEHPVKYIVMAVITRRNEGPGLHVSHGAYWDAETDRVCQERWENPSIVCVVSVFVIAAA